MLTTRRDSAFDMQMQRAVQSGRCPICSLLRKDEFDELCRWVGGNVADERNRARLDEAGGFCNYHSWKLSELHSPYSASLVNDYAAQKALEALRDHDRADLGHLAQWFRGCSRRCPLCDQMEICEAQRVSDFVNLVTCGSRLGAIRDLRRTVSAAPAAQLGAARRKFIARAARAIGGGAD